MTVYDIRLSVQKDGKTYIQSYDGDLVYISEWELSASLRVVQNFASDDDGNIYLGWIGNNYLRKFTNAGVADGTLFIYEVRDVAIDTAGYINALTKYQTTQYRIYQVDANLSLRGILNLDSGTFYSGLAFEDDDIFYTNNLGTVKIEKWSWTDQEKKLVSTNSLLSGVSSMGLIGDVLGGTYTTSCWTMNKNLTGAIASHTIDECPVTGEIYARYFAFLGVVGDNFIVVFRMVTENYLGYGAWFLRRYDSSFTQVGATVVLATSTSSTSHYFRVATKRAVAVEPSITTQAVTQITDYMCAMGNGTIVSGADITERGFEVKVYVDYFGVGSDIWWGMLGFEDEGEIVYHSFGQRTGYLIKRETWEGEFEPGVFEGVLGKATIFGNPGHAFNDGLEPGYEYGCRAYMVIDEVYYYGDWVDFDTIAPDGVYPSKDDISEGNPTVPIIPIDIELEYPPFEYEYPPEIEYPPWEWDIPDWEMPDYPPMSFVGDFYYRKPYTKKDLDDLRRKCIIYNKNSVEFALVLRHNMNVLKEFFNMMTDYMGKDEYNDFTDLIPPQRLKELYLDPLDPTDFRDMINGFIRNTIDNNIAVNRNFKLINEATTDPQENNEEGVFRGINSNIKTVTEDDPDVHRLKKKIDSLNQEVSFNFGNIMRNLKIIRARLL